VRPADSYFRQWLRALGQPVTYLGVAMLTLIYCALVYLLIIDRKHAQEDAERRGGNLVRVLDQSFSHIFKSADASLLFLRKTYQQDPVNFDLAAWVRASSIRNKLTFNFAIIDAGGRIADSNNTKGAIGTAVGDREYFRAHVNSAADELFISEPITMKISGKLAIALSRRVTAADGAFAGVITIFLDPGELARYIGVLELGQHGSIALLGLDGVMRTLR
jgi:hypothetical protein